MIPAILESGGAKSRSSLQMSLYSTSSSPSSSIRMLEPETMEERREVCELLPELLNSDMGEMHVERPGRKKSLVGKILEKKANLTWRRSRCQVELCLCRSIHVSLFLGEGAHLVGGTDISFFRWKSRT